MQLIVTNLSANPLFLSDLYATIQPGASLTTSRTESDLSRMKATQDAVATGLASVSITPTANEVASGMLAELAAPATNINTEEFILPLAAAANNMMAATNSVAVARTLLPGAPAVGVLTQATITNLAAAARQLVFTTAGVVPANQPATAIVTGTDVRGRAVTETVYLANVAGARTTGNFFASVSSIALSAGSTAGGVATLAIGLGTKIGLAQLPVTRAGWVLAFREVVSGVGIVLGGAVQLPDTLSVARVKGTVDQTTPTLTTETLIMSVDGGAPATCTFATPATAAAVIAAINAVFPGVATLDTTTTVGSAFVVLRGKLTGAAGSIGIVSTSTALTKLGLTAGITPALLTAQLTEYGKDMTGGATLVAETLTMSVDYRAPATVTFNSPLSATAVINAVNAVFPGVATLDATTTVGASYLVLTSTKAGVAGSIQIVAGSTALTKLGLTAGITQGTSNGTYGAYVPNGGISAGVSYALTYEYVQAA